MEEYISYHKIIQLFENYQISQKGIGLNSFGHGNIVDFGMTSSGVTPTYPFMFVTPQQISYNENTTNWTIQVIFADRIHDDMSNEIDVISDMSIQAKRFISYIRRGFDQDPPLYDFMDCSLPVGSNPFMERFNDYVGGVSLNLEITVFEDINACDYYNFVPTPTPSVTPTITPTITATVTPTITPTPTLTPTPSPGPAFDPDAAAYLADVITAGGSVDATMSAATDTLFTSLKSAGLYSKIKVMYPMLGGTIGSTAVEGKQPGTKDISWNGTILVDSSGTTSNGTTGYGDIPLNMSVDMTAYTSSNHISYYSLTSGQSGDGFSWDIGIGNLSTGNPLYGLVLRRFSSNSNDFIFDTGNYGTGRLGTTSTNASGFILGSAESSSSRKLFRNGILITSGSTTTSGSILNGNFWLFRPNAIPPTTINYAQHKCAFLTIGDGLNDTESSNLETIINTFQTTLGRNTY